ncbi:hypothetical protein SCYAM73S_06571 [Streptomyces cyaneofuscatus]
MTAVDRPESRAGASVDSGVLMAIGAAVHAREVLRFDYSPGVRTPALAAGGGGRGEGRP